MTGHCAARCEWRSEGSVNSSALRGVRLRWIGRRGLLLGDDAGNSFGIQAEIREWCGLDVLNIVDLDEHRVGVLRGGVESEMLRADVVIKEPWFGAVFSSARVQLHRRYTERFERR